MALDRDRPPDGLGLTPEERWRRRWAIDSSVALFIAAVLMAASALWPAILGSR